MKNVKLIDNSHMSGSSESESNLNKIMKSNNSLKRFNVKNFETKSVIKTKKSTIKDIFPKKESENDPYTMKFLNKTVKEKEHFREKLNNKEIKNYTFKSPEDKPPRETQKCFKIIINPFTLYSNNMKVLLSNSSNLIMTKYSSLNKIKKISEGVGNQKAENINHLFFQNRHLNQNSLLFKDDKQFGKKLKEPIANQKEKDDPIYPDYLIRSFPIIKNVDSNSISDIIDSPNKLGFSKTATTSVYLKRNDQVEIKNLYTILKEEKIKVEEDVIKKEFYYRRLNKKGEKEDALIEQDLIKDYQKQKILITDKKPLDTYMPPGLVKSANSGDFYKFNLYDEIKIDSKTDNLTNSPNKLDKRYKEIENIKQAKRVMTPRMLIYKKNDPEVKFKVLNDFIDKFNPKKFKSIFFRYRKIYVILDGSAVLNLNIVPGKLIDIPTVKYMEEIKNKKERIQILLKFVETCRDVFGLNVKIKNVYDFKGRVVYDIAQIPDESKFLYVSTNEIFVGISIINYNERRTNIIMDKKEFDFEYRKKIDRDVNSKVKIDYFEELIRQNNSKVKMNNMKNNDMLLQKNLKFVSHKEDYLKKEKFLDKKRNYSFDIGYFISKNYLEDEKLKKSKNKEKPQKLLIKGLSKNLKRFNYILSERYISDDEKEKNRANTYLSKNHSDPFKIFSYFLDYFTNMNKFFMKNKIIQAFNHNKEKEEKKNSSIKRLEEEEIKSRLFLHKSKENNLIGRINDDKKIEDEIIELIDNFNSTIENKLDSLDNYIRKKKLRKNAIRPDCPDKRTLILKKEMVASTKLIMKNFLLGFQLFGSSQESRGDYNLSDNREEILFLKYVDMNKKIHDNIYYDLDKKVNSTIPTLFSFNIPKILEKYKNFTRSELYDLFVQYKVIVKISMAFNKDRSIANKGINFMGFYKGVPQIINESTELAYKIFNVINESKTNYLSLDEFLKGMSVNKSEEISDKIDEFFKIIDSDGNGQLSWDEVYEISMMSLKRSLVVDEEKSEGLVKELAEYLADLIFKLVDVDINEEIPLPKIKEELNF